MDDKKKTRAVMRARLASLPTEHMLTGNVSIFMNVLSLPEYQEAKTIFTYYSIGHEPDTRQFIRTALEMGRVVAIPQVTGSTSMEFALIESMETLVKGSHDIPTVGLQAKRLRPGPDDIMLVPALAFDSEGNRLGRGKGYFDRYLAGIDTFTVGLCWDAMIMQELPYDEHDIPVDCIVTEEKISRLRKEPRE